jgi:uncharacterized protein
MTILQRRMLRKAPPADEPCLTTPSSDVDVGVLYSCPLEASRRFELATTLARALERPVDVVDLHSLAGTILRRILCNGVMIINRSSHEYFALLRAMIFDQADFMPYVRRTLEERQRRFCHG